MGKPILELRGVTCHMGSQCYLPPDTSERTPAQPQPVINDKGQLWL